jgi:copper homeostasis protein
MKFSLEICAGSISSALAAQEGGADRVELCDNLFEGGTTPSYGMMKMCLSLLKIPFFPIIRPRGGNFVYSDLEFITMKHDVLCCLEMGCPGIVFGILLPDGRVDTERCAELVRLSGSMELTFHRAFDRCTDRVKGLEELISMGFNRVLTSGGMDYAVEGIPELKRLVSQAENRISIMPGSGITSENLYQVLTGTGAVEFHTTAKRSPARQEGAVHERSPGTQRLYETDLAKVKELRALLNSNERFAG